MFNRASRLKQKQAHRYQGRHPESLTIPPCSDTALLVEVRARQRTFNGAYARTALGTLGYSLAILRFFDSRFYSIGLLFALQALLLFVISFFRDRHSKYDFTEEDEENFRKAHIIPDYTGLRPKNKPTKIPASVDLGTTATGLESTSLFLRNTYSRTEDQLRGVQTFNTVSASGQRIFGRPFVTAGWIVIVVSTVILSTEVLLIGQIMRL
ncbi:hypothetical protein L218DRAFT_453149 [Marasmius fiardii PR-910]|nr:hypothetical protein L218DRAFT_453149 [Marasmius fiardii PR-910]